MRPMLRPDGLALVGEPYWIGDPPASALKELEGFTTLAGTDDRFEAAGFELVEMVLADPDSWDRYMASQWLTLSDWLLANPDDADAPALRDFLRQSRRSHLEYGRQHLGWGVFVLRPKAQDRT
ncbi:hypothetical protein GCM10020219_093220 [Nonomuraea dietziae]